jgi:sulfate permease, SulP family
MRDASTSPLSLVLRYIHFHPLPIWRTLRTYNLPTFRADLKAGMTVAALTLPQAMAYAMIAGLPPQYGLYAAIVGGFFAALFGSSNHLVCEPTNATAIVLAGALLQFQDRVDPLNAVLVVTFLVGFFHLIAGLSKFGNITSYISRSVIIGYTAGAIILIASNQVHNLLGFKLQGAKSFYELWAETLYNLPDTNLINLAIGLFGIVFMRAMKQYRPLFPGVLLFLLISALLGAAYNVWNPGERALPVVGAILPRLPPFNAPEIDLETARWMMSSALAITLLGMLEATAISKTIAASSGQIININQELIGLGAGNLGASFFGGMPISGSLTRSTLNYQIGAKTRMATIFTSLIVALAILLAGPLTQYIPIVSLAAVVIVVAAQSISMRLIRFAVRATRADAIVFFGTFFSTLFMPLDIAIYFGVGLSLALFLHKVSAPHLVEYSFTDEGSLREIDSPKKRLHAQISIIHVEGALFFGASDLFQTQIRHICSEESIRVIILRMKNARHLDATTVMAMDQLLEYLKESGRHLIISGITPDVGSVLKRSGLIDKIGAENIFPAEANLNVSTRNALKRALNLIHEASADIRIFYDKSKASSATHEQPPIIYEI